MPGTAKYDGQRGICPFEILSTSCKHFGRGIKFGRKTIIFLILRNMSAKLCQNLHFKIIDVDVINGCKFSRKAITFHLIQFLESCHQIRKQVGNRHNLLPRTKPSLTLPNLQPTLYLTCLPATHSLPTWNLQPINRPTPQAPYE